MNVPGPKHETGANYAICATNGNDGLPRASPSAMKMQG